jgi:BolA protein
MAPATPMEDAIRTKVTEALKPSTLEIYNDSHLHSHHKAMVESQNASTEVPLPSLSNYMPVLI